jgi:hypothetical protein
MSMSALMFRARPTPAASILSSIGGAPAQAAARASQRSGRRSGASRDARRSVLLTTTYGLGQHTAALAIFPQIRINPLKPIKPVGSKPLCSIACGFDWILPIDRINRTMYRPT